jgi:hypothetical protein
MFAPVRNFYCDEEILHVGFQHFTFIDILGGTLLYFALANRTPGRKLKSLPLDVKYYPLDIFIKPFPRAEL